MKMRILVLESKDNDGHWWPWKTLTNTDRSKAINEARAIILDERKALGPVWFGPTGNLKADRWRIKSYRAERDGSRAFAKFAEYIEGSDLYA